MLLCAAVARTKEEAQMVLMSKHQRLGVLKLEFLELWGRFSEIFVLIIEMSLVSQFGSTVHL